MNLERLTQIQPLDEEAMAQARARQNQLTKPQGSLGRLEDLAIQIAGIMGDPRPRLTHKVITTMAGDHGIVAQGVSAFPQEVTPQMVVNFLNGGAAINVLARHVGARVVVVDMGVAVDMNDFTGLLNMKVKPGTRDFSQGPAMTRDQAIQAVLAGADVVEEEVARGLDILGTGEMGIGNTTPATAIAAALTAKDPLEITGPGTGLDAEGVAHKAAIIRRGLEVNQPDSTDALDVLSKVGGFEIGGLAGAMLAAAHYRRPVMVDGFISTAAAMIAVALAPDVRPYLIAAHRSEERGHGAMLAWLGLDPLLDLNMRLGEGTGAALAMSLADAACKLLDEMATFDEAAVAGKKQEA